MFYGLIQIAVASIVNGNGRVSLSGKDILLESLPDFFLKSGRILIALF